MDYTRLTVRGAWKQAELVLPDDLPVAELLPDVVDLLDEHREGVSQAVVLVTALGERLDTSLSLADQELPSGSYLRLVRVDEAPAPPEVADVTGTVADAAERRRDRWLPIYGTGLAAITAAGAGWLASGQLAAIGQAPSWACLALSLVALVVAVAAARTTTSRALAAPLLAFAVGAVVPAAATIGDLDPTLTAVCSAAAALAVLAVGAYAGFRSVGLAVGSLVGVALMGIWGGLIVADVPEAPSIVAVIGIFILGILPPIALRVSGLAALDDGAASTGFVSHARVDSSLAQAYSFLTYACIAAALTTGIAITMTAAHGDPLHFSLFGVVLLVLCLRLRYFPLAAQRIALTVSFVIPVFTALLTAPLSPTVRAAFAVGIGLLAVGFAGVRVPDHVAARLRRISNLLELAAVVAMLPLLLATLGVFADLAETFR